MQPAERVRVKTMADNLFQPLTASELDQFCTRMERALDLYETLNVVVNGIYLAPPRVMQDEILDVHGDAYIRLTDILYDS